MKKCPLTVYTASHFLVDLACGYTLYSMYAEGKIEAASVAVLFILYNMLAFATQHLFGALADKVNSNGSTFAFVGIISTAIGVMIRGAAPWVSVCFVGLGNACFHVGGGIDALTESQGFTRAGIFVSSGALGIALGCRFGQNLLFPPALYVLSLALAALAVAIFCRGEQKVIPDEVTSQTVISSSTLAICILLFAVVIRSYAGFAATKPTEVFPPLHSRGRRVGVYGKAARRRICRSFRGKTCRHALASPLRSALLFWSGFGSFVPYSNFFLQYRNADNSRRRGA